MATYQQEKIYGHEMRNGELETLHWPEELVYKHITEDIYDPVIQLRLRLEEVQTKIKQFGKSIYTGTPEQNADEVDPGGPLGGPNQNSKVVDHASARSYKEFVQLEKMIIQQLHEEIKRSGS
jgi:hypothetical protein